MLLADIPTVLAYRLLPFLAYVTVARGIAVGRRAVVLGLFVISMVLALLMSRDTSEVIVRGPLALGYFAALSLGIHAIERRLPDRTVPMALLFVACAVGYVLVPVLVHRSPFVIATIGLGFEAMLSAYSYAVEARREHLPPSRSECVFFILVNPCVLYTERGSVDAPGKWSSEGIGRIGLGATAWGAQAIVQSALVTMPPIASEYSRFMLGGGGAGLALYLAHSGLASIQIGLTKVVGRTVPERYARPLGSESPMEFWRRWNRYLGAWIRRYVFTPAAFGLRRVFLRISPTTSTAVAVLLTFIVVGLLHQYVIWILGVAANGALSPSFEITFAFVAFGVMLLVWRAGTLALRHGRSGRSHHSVSMRRTRIWVSRLAFVHVACAMMWILQRAHFAL